MRFSRFFIDRPIFAAVVSIVIFIAGLISMFGLPVSEYPDVVPPSVVVRAVYPGANPRVISEAVATPLGQYLHCEIRRDVLEAYTAELLRRAGGKLRSSVA